jgi:RNA polymerase sigma factor (sigma-70 family)
MRAARPYACQVLTEDVASRFCDGDPDAVRALYREYGRLVYAVAYKVLGERGLAEEAAQQAFLKAWRGARSFEPTRDLAPWLATIARRAAIDIHRREARRVHERLEDVAPSDPAVVTLPQSEESIYEVWRSAARSRSCQPRSATSSASSTWTV